ncbi:MAG: NFACT family protein [Pegethrix bostrychoides GSE-TBD4-15B]|jgi:predicted ribosome quality control (RQC) complex YloA/Tae2 family protein|uniref:Rqc2 homolog RqcH n=1 Tax=Pegethrix bostrychoides GSE-TBD4-15B TaxID=2839662 RepID=A0A951P8D7_9CYAN|nr:NFACT family protein [Pegethrix bostrychoides GSE-TBD4-15B]
MQPLDFTTLTAAAADLRASWLPARLEQVYQRDRHLLYLGLRTLERRGWLTLCWHPQAARICIGDSPPRIPDTFTFSQQLRHQLGGLALVAIAPVADWERVVDLQFAQRPGDPLLWHLYVEIMGNYSNVILANQDNLVISAAHQVSSQQSSLRPIQTGQPYALPPALNHAMPALEESFERWQERLALIPAALKRSLLKNYRGLSSSLVASMAAEAGLDPEQSTAELSLADWQRLFAGWQDWQQALKQQQFQPGWLSEAGRRSGYTVLGWGKYQPENLQTLLHRYYSDALNQQEFGQLHHQIRQRLTHLIKKLSVKAADFRGRLAQSDQADRYREQADLLMAYLHAWQPGMSEITLADFETAAPVKIKLEPEKNAVQNAQAFYKRHQKLKRSRAAVEPLLVEVRTELDYLEQVEASLMQLDSYHSPADLASLTEIRAELIQQGYLEDPEQRYRSVSLPETPYLRYSTPSGFEVLIGRNNRQNDQLTFRLAGDYDLWFHTQEIPGSHLLLRVSPGAVAADADLQVAADLAAYYSRARQSDQAPVIYTQPKFVYKPKGAKPGIAIYKQETVIWGEPQRGKTYQARLDEPPHQ